MRFFLFLFCLTTGVAQAQVQDCSQFRTGTFYYPNIDKSGYIIRRKKIQKAFFERENRWVYWKLTWNDDCSYELSFWKAEKDNGYFKAGDRIYVRITSVEDNCYHFISVFYSGNSSIANEDISSIICKK